MADEHRGFKFYSEIVLAASLSIIIANTWLRVLYGYVDSRWPKSLNVSLIVAVLATFIGISLLWALFSRQKALKDENGDPKLHAMY